MIPALLSDEEIFQAARRMETAARVAYLDEVCRDNATLRTQVEALLAAYEASNSFLEAPAAAAMAVGLSPGNASFSERPGTIIGHYKLLQPLGEGGMGIVFLAEQTEPIQRTVALKLIKAGMDSKQVIARFEAERQALAIMDHPNIARVLDAGTTETGRPYFVMDLVKGVPITGYCDEHHLTPRQRLELFIPVCLAVQHAHQKGVIHRDIKPTNVLVAQLDPGAPGVPKVIDFGVAKATGRALTEKTLVTDLGNIVGTLEYMSPEQAELNQVDIDTRSDIYSLGVLLYELLTGSTPFARKDLQQAGMLEMLRVIREEEPTTPSAKLSTSDGLPTLAANRGTEPVKLTRLVRGELDWIVMKALEKDRNRRYKTANDFAMDVERYLTDAPVQACPPSAWYRIRKFGRRNKRALATGALLAVMLLAAVGTVAGIIGWSARDRAARQARLTGQVKLILDEAERWQQEQNWPEALVNAMRANALMTRGDGELQLRVQTLVNNLTLVHQLEQIRLQRTESHEGDFLNEKAEHDYAAVFREHGIDAQLLTAEEAAEQIRSRPAVAVALVAALDDWSHLLRLRHEKEGAKTLTLVAQAADPDPWRRRVRTAMVEEDWKTLEQLASSDEILQLPPATLFMLAHSLMGTNSPQGLKILRNAQREYPGDFWINFDLGYHLSRGKPLRLDESIGCYRAALAARPSSASVHLNLGHALGLKGENDEAIAYFRKAILLAPDYALAHFNLGNTLGDQGHVDEAIESLRRAAELQPEWGAPDFNLGNLLLKQGKVDEAIAAYRRSLAQQPDLAELHTALGLAFAAQGELDEAIIWHKKALALNSECLAAHNNLGAALRHRGDLEEAIAAFRSAIAVSPDCAQAHINLGQALLELGNLAEARSACEKGIELEPTQASFHADLGNVLFAQGHVNEALSKYHDAIALDPTLAQPHSGIGGVLRSQLKFDEAIAAYRTAIKLDPTYAAAYGNLGSTLTEKGQFDEAIEALNKAIELKPRIWQVHFNLGWIFHKQGQLDAAIESFRKAIELKPLSIHVHLSLAHTLDEKGQPDEAIVVLREAIDRYSKNDIQNQLATAQNDLGNLLHKQGRQDEAVIAYHEALRLDAHSPLPDRAAIIHRNHALARKDQEKWVEAVAAFEDAIRVNKNYVAAHVDLAELLLVCPDAAQRNSRRAVVLSARAVELDPHSIAAWQNLGWAQYGAGNWQASIQALEKSCELQEGGDCGQWIVLALSHARLAHRDGLAEAERDEHLAQARLWYAQAIAQIDGHPELNDPIGRAIRMFRQEAAELLDVK